MRNRYHSDIIKISSSKKSLIRNLSCIRNNNGMYKTSSDPRLMGLIVGALIGSRIAKSRKILGPVTGGALGLLLANIVMKGGDISSKILNVSEDPVKQEPLRRLTVSGVNNVYGQPGYNPRY